MISREMAQDKSISPKAKGVLLYLLSLPENWKIYHNQLQDGLGIGEEYLNSALEELIKAGYAERERKRVNGMYQPYSYTIREFKKCLPNRENQPGSSGPEIPVLQSTQDISSNEDISKKTTTTKKDVVVVSSNAEKLKELAKFPLNKKTIEKSLSYSLDEIKLAIECCLNSIESIKDIDAYFWSALSKKWQPKPDKEKIVKLKEETEKKQQQDRQRIYAEAKNLQQSSKLKDGYRFCVEDNCISVKNGNGWFSLEFTDEGLANLKEYIRKNSKRVFL
jgi:DNA-binding MarR family transcriptional regulator